MWRQQLLERALGIGPEPAAEHRAEMIGEKLG